MRLLLLIFVTGAVSTGAGALFNHAISEWLPCLGEGLACKMDGIVGLLAVFVVGPLAAIVLGIVVYAKPGTKPLAIAFGATLLPIAFLLYVTLSEILLVRDGASFFWREYQKLLQIVVSPAIAVVLQWPVFQIYLSRKTAG
jgi:hypothetical protein